MDVLMSIRKGGLPKAASLQHFEDYRKNEGTGNLASVNKEGSLVEYETLVGLYSAHFALPASGRDCGELW